MKCGSCGMNKVDSVNGFTPIIDGFWGIGLMCRCTYCGRLHWKKDGSPVVAYRNISLIPIGEQVFANEKRVVYFGNVEHPE